eukprot:Skav216109  [mRNA]  locus=scaffold1946:70554:94906:+ [translate_table: standard]
MLALQDAKPDADYEASAQEPPSKKQKSDHQSDTEADDQQQEDLGFRNRRAQTQKFLYFGFWLPRRATLNKGMSCLEELEAINIGCESCTFDSRLDQIRGEYFKEIRAMQATPAQSEAFDFALKEWIWNLKVDRLGTAPAGAARVPTAQPMSARGLRPATEGRLNASGYKSQVERKEAKLPSAGNGQVSKSRDRVTRTEVDLWTKVEAETMSESDLAKIFRHMLLGVAHTHVPPSAWLKVRCTAPYMAPEMLRNEGYDFLADVWSIGSVAYLLVFGSFPYSPGEANAPAMKKAIIEDNPPLKFPSLSDAQGVWLFNGCLGLHKDASKADSQRKANCRRGHKQHPALQHEFVAEKVKAAEPVDTEPMLRKNAHRAKKLTQQLQQKRNSMVQHGIDDLLKKLITKFGGDISGSNIFFSEGDEKLTLNEEEDGGKSAEPRMKRRSSRRATLSPSSVTGARTGKSLPGDAASLVALLQAAPVFAESFAIQSKLVMESSRKTQPACAAWSPVAKRSRNLLIGGRRRSRKRANWAIAAAGCVWLRPWSPVSFSIADTVETTHRALRRHAPRELVHRGKGRDAICGDRKPGRCLGAGFIALSVFGLFEGHDDGHDDAKDSRRSKSSSKGRKNDDALKRLLMGEAQDKGSRSFSEWWDNLPVLGHSEAKRKQKAERDEAWLAQAIAVQDSTNFMANGFMTQADMDRSGLMKMRSQADVNLGGGAEEKVEAEEPKELIPRVDGPCPLMPEKEEVTSVATPEVLRPQMVLRRQRPDEKEEEVEEEIEEEVEEEVQEEEERPLPEAPGSKFQPRQEKLSHQGMEDANLIVRVDIEPKKQRCRGEPDVQIRP